MKTYKIPVIYEMTGEYEIEAESLEEAVRIAIEDKPVPEDSEYLSDSMFVDKDGINEDDLDDKDKRFFKNDLLEPFKIGI